MDIKTSGINQWYYKSLLKMVRTFCQHKLDDFDKNVRPEKKLIGLLISMCIIVVGQWRVE